MCLFSSPNQRPTKGPLILLFLVWPDLLPADQTHQVQRHGQQQQEQPEVEMAAVSEFALLRVVVPASGQCCPHSLPEQLHCLGNHRQALHEKGRRLNLLAVARGGGSGGSPCKDASRRRASPEPPCRMLEGFSHHAAGEPNPPTGSPATPRMQSKGGVLLDSAPPPLSKDRLPYAAAGEQHVGTGYD